MHARPPRRRPSSRALPLIFLGLPVNVQQRREHMSQSATPSDVGAPGKPADGRPVAPGTPLNDLDPGVGAGPGGTGHGEVVRGGTLGFVPFLRFRLDVCSLATCVCPALPSPPVGRGDKAGGCAWSRTHMIVHLCRDLTVGQWGLGDPWPRRGRSQHMRCLQLGGVGFF